MSEQATEAQVNDPSKPPPITDETILRLYTVAGGRCSFCNVYLLDEPLTRKKALLGNVAHIVGKKPNGPRGSDPLPMARRSDIENLILLCPLHHGFVDKKELEAEYPTALLQGYKKVHEDHVRAMTGTERKERTTALRMVGQIRDHLVAISDADVRSAVFAHEERYVDEIIDIDIGTIPDAAGSAYIETARTKILSELRYRILPQIQDGKIHRLSLFALSRIPLLCELGYGIGDKVHVELYQHHRAPIEGWKWQPNGVRVRFEVVEHVRADSGDASRVAVLLGVSGGDVDKVQASSRAKSMYVVRPTGVDPTRTIISSPHTLEEFRGAYQALLSRIEKEHPHAVGVDLFLAAPAPVAFIAGRDVARDVVPNIVIHDLVNGQYVASSVLKTKTSSAFAPSERAPVLAPSLS